MTRIDDPRFPRETWGPALEILSAAGLGLLLALVTIWILEASGYMKLIFEI